MDELQGAAVAYYNNGTYNQQELLKDFFKSMDTNGDGKVTWSEFSTYLQQNGYYIDRNLYNKLDINGDGLDLKAVLTVYYIITTRSLVCGHCGEHLLGLYFSCVECFNRAANTYNLCITCYAKKRFSHRHAHFLDNHMLLMRKKMEALASDNPNQVIEQCTF